VSSRDLTYEERIEFGPYLLYPATGEVLDARGRGFVAVLSESEMDVLQALLDNFPRIAHTPELMRELAYNSVDTLRAHVSHIRAKIHPRLIRTYSKRGYMLNVQRVRYGRAGVKILDFQSTLTVREPAGPTQLRAAAGR
jgi:DNA-binding response OmpR family regulator